MDDKELWYHLMGEGMAEQAETDEELIAAGRLIDEGVALLTPPMGWGEREDLMASVTRHLSVGEA